jgi:hypothetical protein
LIQEKTMNDLISRFRIFPGAGAHKEMPRSIHPGNQPLGTPLRRDTPELTSIEVGGDTPPPGPSGLRDGFEY